MFSWKKLGDDASELSRYYHKVADNFSKLAITQSLPGAHFAAFYQGEIVGGVTLQHYQNLSDDLELTKYWNIHHSGAATRIMRLWSEKRNKKNALPCLFEAIRSHIPKDSFIYGMLSLPLSYAQKHQNIFLNHRQWLVPHQELQECRWEMNYAPSSHGRRLLPLYLKAGAEFLGPPSGTEKDHSIRVLMGMDEKNIKYTPGREL